MTKIFDITRTINPSLAVWPGDTPFSAEVITAIKDGSSINLTTLTMSSHMGTHVDAPYHFLDDDLTMEAVLLEAYIGPATVVTVQREAGPLTAADFPGLDWSRVERLLVHSVASDKPVDQFPTEFVYPSPELAELMARYGVVLFGSDAPSMDDMNSKTLPGHKALRRHRIAILEGLLLTGVPDGNYELIALPLKIEGGDGSPVRAVLRG
ncbi:MAG: cyclase family protein [Anaerolineae bacterium]|nr:cyclase family protein [Anaerolineales bacterium]MCQ3972862.1 kynurenine formamidase [Anaerolineae bacterium]